MTLIFIGWVNIFSSVYNENFHSVFDVNQRYGKQLIWICAAIIIAAIVILLDTRFYEFFAYGFYAIIVFLLLMVLVFGKEVNSSKSWFMIGGLQIQPSEFAKPAVALALAKYLSTYNLNIKSFSTLLKAGIIIFIPIFLILMQPDTGTALIFFAFILPLYREGFSWLILFVSLLLIIIFFLVLTLPEFIVLCIVLGTGFLLIWIVTGSFKNFGFSLLLYLSTFGIFFGISELSGLKWDLYETGLLALLPTSFLYILFIIRYRIKKVVTIAICISLAVVYSFTVDYGFDNILNEYQRNRIYVTLGIKSDPLGAGYNVNQSKIAIGSGGLSGKGFLQGTQTKLSFVPEQTTDFIFCTVGEEWGFVGSVTVIALFSILLLRLIKLAERQRSLFSRVYGYGVISVLLLHFTINISMTIGLFPVIGIPLPFISYGGSSLWSFTILLFIFLRLDASRTEYML